MSMLELRARSEFGLAYDALEDSEQAKLQAEIRPEIRLNTYDPATGSLVISDERAQAIAQVAAHYMSVFSNDTATADLREAYALREDPVPDMEHRRMMTGFFFWASWATVTDRSEEHTSELQSLMRNSYAVFCLKKKNKNSMISTT